MQTYYRPQRSCEGYVFTGVCLSTGGGVPDQVHPHRTRYTPRAGTPPSIRYTSPSRPGTPPGRYTPLGPGTPPRPGAPPGQVHSPGRYPPDHVHPHPPQGTPPQAGIPPEIRPLLRTVRILLECIFVLN